MGMHMAGLTSRAAVMVIASLSLPEFHPSMGELAVSTAAACAEAGERFAVDKARLDYHTEKVGEAEAEMTEEQCVAARATLRKAASRIDSLNAFVNYLNPLCRNGVMPLKVVSVEDQLKQASV